MKIITNYNKSRITTLEKRENLRDKGQFWTPGWVADAMVAYVSQEADEVFDPGVGRGIFYASLKKFHRKAKFYGIDIDPKIIAEAKKEGIFDNNSRIERRDFILNPPSKLFRSIVANPPYIRHHRLSPEIKSSFKKISLHAMRETLDGRAGLHIYFLIQALSLLDKNGRLAFIMPADTCEGVFSKKLWAWITGNFCLEGVITFDHKATPFPGVDTNAIIFLIKNTKQSEKIKWARCLEPQSKDLLSFLRNNLAGNKYSELIVHERNLSEALSIGLSRMPQKNYNFEFTLNDFAYVMRGIATGANEFFFLTREKVKELGMANKFFLPAIGRTRDVAGDRITQKAIKELEKKGRPTLLFFPNGVVWENMPAAVKNYILEGERKGISGHILISTRRPWYKMEVRKIPAFLFAYLGRRNIRFIKNEAGVVPLTSFLCVYPRSDDREFTEKLWEILQHPSTIANLRLVGKSYGSGAIKVEPRSLERLPIDSWLVNKVRIKPIKSELSLFERLKYGQF